MLKITTSFSDFGKDLRGTEDQIAQIVTRAMQRTSDAMKAEARTQVESAGFGRRLANTWRGNVYPQRAASLNPSAYLWSNAPAIIDSFSSGRSIMARSGSQWLMIPTPAVPARARKEARTRKQSLALRVEVLFNQDLIFIREKGGKLGAYVKALAGRRSGTFRPATAGRRRQGRDAELIKMFSVVRSVARPAVLDLNRIAQVGQQAFPRHLQDNWR
jgi:hypothetical protein